MAAGGSRRVVVIALFANLAIALAKLVAAVFTRSGSMLAEAIHSFADTGNQALLLVGDARATRPPNEHHPMGYGREAYFWAMLVAMLLFTMGGLFSAYEGFHKLQHPEPLRHVAWAVGVLVVAIVIETYSCKAAWDEFRRTAQGVPLFRWARTTGDVNLLVVVFEDLAALLGLVIALLAVLVTWLTDQPVFDALGTLVLAVLLLAVAVFLASQVRRLITGHSVGAELRAEIDQIWQEHGFRVVRLLAVWAGPNKMTVAVKVAPRAERMTAEELIAGINSAETVLRQRRPEISMQFSEPDTSD
jgi:cation diffusion facilitator family transporter